MTIAIRQAENGIKGEQSRFFSLRRCDQNSTPLQKSCVSSLAEPCHDADNRQTHEQQIENLILVGTWKPNDLHPVIDGTMQQVHEEARLAELRENRGRF
jgi:protein required for attachment to host cells